MSGIQASFNLFESLFIDGSCQNSSCCRTIPSFIICLICDIFNKSGSYVDSFIRKLNSFSNCDSVFSNFRWSVALIYQNVSTSWTQCDLNCIRELSASLKKLFAGLTSKEKLLCSIVSLEMDKILGSLCDSWEHKIYYNITCYFSQLKFVIFLEW